MTINNEQGNFQEGARVPEPDVLGRTWGTKRSAESTDQGEEIVGAAIEGYQLGREIVASANESVGQLTAPAESPESKTDDSAVTSLPMSVSHSDLVAASKRYGTDWEAK